MKRKPKLNLVLQLATICLCVCAIAIGVYSVKNASLSVTGTIGFTANNCTVKITATTTSADETTSAMKTSDAKSITLGAKDTTGTTETDQILTTNTGSLSLGSLIFCDLIDGGDVITISLKIENKSVFAITANTPAPSLTTAVAGVSCEATASKFNLDAGASKDVTMTITLADIANASSITSNKFTMTLSFEKYTPIQLQVQTDTNFRQYTSDSAYNEISRSYVTMGKLSESSTAEDIRWFIFAKGDADGSNMEAVTGTVATDSNGYLTSGTYWFISEYALDSQAFKSDGSNNVYNTSDIKDYLNGTYLTKYSISSSEVYSIISARDQKDDNDGDSDVGTFTTTQEQKLWLLSVNELNYLNGEKVTSNNTYTNLTATNKSGSTEWWWLRSPSADYDDGAFVVNGRGYVFFDGVSGTYGVRAAFQITI